MSRMSAWNRPSKHAAIPPPYYITSGDDTPYCHTCGRVMNSRKLTKHSSKVDSNTKTPVKYCSERCRKRKPGSLDREIEQAFLTLLEGSDGSSVIQAKNPAKTKKGDSRILVKMDAVEELVFGKQPDSEKRRVGKRNVLDPKTWRSVDMESSESEDISDVDDGVAGGATVVSESIEDKEMIQLQTKRASSNKDEDQQGQSATQTGASDDGAADDVANVAKRDEGQKRAEHKEMVRRAARRGVVFGFLVDETGTEASRVSNNRRKCEAVVNGSVVEPSFAKGNWGVRWRD